MKPYYEQDGITIYHGDCREVLPSLPPVDLVLTDLPYGEVNRDSGGLRGLDKGSADTETFTPQWAATQAARLGKSVYLWCGMEQVSDLRSTLVDAGMTTRLGIWHKTNPSPMNGEHMWLSGLECCVFGRASGAYFNRHCKSPVWTGPTEPNQLHPTQKPLWLMVELVQASAPAGGSVLDFCAGSGTSLVAAKASGCTAIGIELEERYCEIAANRLSQGVLFGGAA
jgi:site-specific DNA-methyltransferase (adenine-specific)